VTVADITDILSGLLSASLEPDQVRSHERDWPVDLWTQLVDLGMTTIDVPEDAGGGGGSLGEALAVVRLCGYFRANLPIVESGFVGAWLRHLADLPPSVGPDGVAVCPVDSVTLDSRGREARLSGRATIGWGRQAGDLLLVCEEGEQARLALINREDAGGTIEWTAHRNLAGEPRDAALLRETPCSLVKELPASILEVRARFALGRSALMVGALEKVTDLSIEHVRTREQFGRPLSSFQVIKHHLATMTAHLAAARAALDLAASSVSPTGAADATATATAKTRIGGATEVITQLGHQVHGAIGVTDEHELGLSTRRLWAWRDEDGDEQHWARLLGREVASRAYAGGLWSTLQPAAD
jgi:acyl-CoA dehydrogenase